MLNRTIPENVQVDLKLSSRNPFVEIDRGQLEQVIMNIAVNARDAMPSGGTFTIWTSDQTVDEDHAALSSGLQPGPYVRLSMIDTGSGMDQKTAGRVFEPFFTTKERGSGTGLGLATVYGIVQHSGGHISVTSGVGAGTRFDIYLPMSHAIEEPEVEAPAEPNRRGGGETILVAEDEAGVRRIVERVLSANGYRVLAAASGNQALEVAAANDGVIDLLLTDLVMPQMSGTELSSQLEHIPSLFMSGYSEEMASAQGLRYDTDNYIQKPFTPEELMDKIREVLQKQTRAELSDLSH
jgi:two-component system, cell cycle sensor histidine kinase and response regulator CckA